MKKKNAVILVGVILLLLLIFMFIKSCKKKDLKTDTLTATVLKVQDKEVMVQDQNNIIYTFSMDKNDLEIGDLLTIEYTGILDKNKNLQNSEIIDYVISTTKTNDAGIPTSWLDDGIFKDYYTMAYNKLKTLSLDEKIGQLLLVRYPDNAIDELKKYHFGGFVFFEKDFKDKTETEIKEMISNIQKNSKIPLLTAVDEEGGKVVRVSTNPNLVPEKFKSSKELYQLGGFSKIKEDTIQKSNILYNLGLNLNLAPVVDVSTDPKDYMYERALGENTETTSKYAKTVIEASKGTGVSYTLKHFPGYGNNADTHTGSSIDNRSYDDIVINDLPPFEAGISVGAEAILFSHNTVKSIDTTNPISLSINAHNILRNKLKFTGIIMTDNLDMGAITSTDDAIVKAILAGNDLIITTDYKKGVEQIKESIQNGSISEDLINKLAFRVLAWKYYKNMMIENQK